MKAARQFGRLFGACNNGIEAELFNKRFQGAGVSVWSGLDKDFWMGLADLEPLVSVSFYFTRLKFVPARMSVVVVVDFCVTFEANWNSVVEGVCTTIGLLYDVIDLNLYAAPAMADAAAPLTSNQ
jgi:hypothetical protein